MYPRIYSKRAGSEAMRGQAQEALSDADPALRVDPKDEEAYNSRGLANRLLCKMDDAAVDFTIWATRPGPAGTGERPRSAARPVQLRLSQSIARIRQTKSLNYRPSI
jgi:hypothetical protein